MARDIQSITMRILETMMTQRFIPEVHLLAGKLVHVVAIHPLKGSRANRHHVPNPLSGAAQPTQNRDPQATSNPLELPLTLRRGTQKNPSQSPELATNYHQHVSKLLRCFKPSRWWQPPRVTRNPQPPRSPSATRCNHSSKYTRNHSQSHYDNESMMEMSMRCLLRLTRMLGMSK